MNNSKYKTLFHEIGTIIEESTSTVFKAQSYSDHKLYAIQKIPFEEKDKDKTLKEVDKLIILDTDYVVKYIKHWVENNYYIGTAPDISLNQSNLLFDTEKKLLLHIQLELYTMPLKYVIQILNNETSSKNSIIAQHYGLACEIFIQVLECVNHLHTRNPPIIHRDLRPENIILVNSNRFIKLINFGLSTYHAFDQHSHTNEVGSKQYRAPEVAGREYDTKADIYSLGLIMQEIFNIDFNKETLNVDDNLKHLYTNLSKLCLECLDIVAKKRPTCEEILKRKESWAFFSPEKSSVNSFDRFRQIATEKYEILFKPELNYKTLITSPFIIDIFIKALLKCVDRKELVKKNLQKWRKLINLNELLPKLYEMVPVVNREKFISLIYRLNELTTEDLKKDFILQEIVNVNDENEFQIFIQILLHTGNNKLAVSMYPPCIDMSDLDRCDPKNGINPYFSFGLFNKPDTIIQKRYEPVLMKECYTMTRKPRGFCFLVNNYFTVGTYIEMQRFRNIFYQLHYDVVMAKNLPSRELSERLFHYSKSDKLDNHDAFVFLIITHGNEKNQIKGFDGEPIDIEEITELFNNENCPKLLNKPKMFFFNCCRGSNDFTQIEGIFNLKKQIFSPSVPKPLPERNDFIICYSTLDGCVAYVNWYSGTNFGQAFADMLVENFWSDDLNTILIKTNQVLMKNKLPVGCKQPIEWTGETNTTKLIVFPI